MSVVRSAIAPSHDARYHEAKVLALEGAVAAASPDRRAHVAALLGAALEHEVAGRVALGLPPWEDRLFRGWNGLPSFPGSVPGVAAADPTARDVELAILRAAEVVRAIVSGPGSAGPDPGGRLEGIVLEPCFEAPAACCGGRGRRRALILLSRLLRRRRPATAAVLRRCLSGDRAWRAGTPRSTWTAAASGTGAPGEP